MASNLNGATFVVGFAAMSYGLASWSIPLAAVVAGVVLMGLAVYPFLRASKG